MNYPKLPSRVRNIMVYIVTGVVIAWLSPVIVIFILTGVHTPNF